MRMLRRLPSLLLLPLLGCPTAPDPPAVEPWPWCPEGVQEEGTTVLEATDAALYCGTFDESRTLAEERAAKVQVLFPESRLASPSEPGEGGGTWPFCIRTPDGQGPTPDGEGYVARSNRWEGSELTVLLNHEQPLVHDGAPSALMVNVGSAPGEHAILDGAHRGLGSERSLSLALCAPECKGATSIQRLDSCTFDGLPTERHSLTFDGGSLDLDLRIGDSIISTQPGIFLGGAGTLDGVAFEQRDYWQTVYSPTLHHFSRDFALLFDDPIGGACGIVAREVDPWGDDPAATVELVDCDLNVLEARAVLTDDWAVLSE